MARRRRAVPKQDDEVDVEHLIEEMPDRFIECREYRHAWRPFTATVHQATRIVERARRCSRCRLIRYEVVTFNGRKISGHYGKYPSGYQLKGSGNLHGPDLRDRVRAESVMRSLTPEQQAQVRKAMG